MSSDDSIEKMPFDFFSGMTTDPNPWHIPVLKTNEILDSKICNACGNLILKSSFLKCVQCPSIIICLDCVNHNEDVVGIKIKNHHSTHVFMFVDKRKEQIQFADTICSLYSTLESSASSSSSSSSEKEKRGNKNDKDKEKEEEEEDSFTKIINKQTYTCYQKDKDIDPKIRYIGSPDFNPAVISILKDNNHNHNNHSDLNKKIQKNQKQYNYAPAPAKKPVIYIYNNKGVNLVYIVKLEAKCGRFTTIYPKPLISYKDEKTDYLNTVWQVETQRDGTLKCDGRKVGFLYYEGESMIKGLLDFQLSVRVYKRDYPDFLEHSALKLGLLEGREVTDFVTYWLADFDKHDSICAQFDKNFIENAVSIKVVPPISEQVRIYMIWISYEIIKTYDSYCRKWEKNQTEAFKDSDIYTRSTNSDNTLVEWGGSEII